MKKPNFPSRPCPKCGNFIHVSAKSHAKCGWTKDASPAAASPATKPQAKTASGNGKAISKMEAVRRILNEHGKETMPVDIQSRLMKQYGIKMEASVISNYKSSILKAGKKIGRPKGPKPATTTVVSAGATTGINLDDIRAVKHLADRLGAEKLQELGAVLAK
jgi:hypothetical protein